MSGLSDLPLSLLSSLLSYRTRGSRTARAHPENSMKRLLSSLALAVALAAALPISPAAAWEIYSCNGSYITWPTPFVQMRTSGVSFPVGSSTEAAVEEAIDAWNDVPSAFTLTHVGNDGSIGVLNGQNEAWATSSEYWLSGNPGGAIVWDNCDYIYEGDVLYDSDYSPGWTSTHTKSNTQAWETSSSPSKRRPIQATAIHELSHVAGFQHENDEYNALGNSWTHVHVNADLLTYYVGEDVADAAIIHYGGWFSGEDVGVVNFKYTGWSGQYSTHDFVDLYNSNGSVIWNHQDSDGDVIFRVDAGDEVQVQFSFENNGLNSQTPLVHYVLSTNDYITTYDTFLAQRSPTLVRNGVYTTTKRITLPTWLVSGQTYYLGAIVDPHNQISEIDEGNNATYIGIEIQ